MIGVNLWGVIHGIRTFLPIMTSQGQGHIVNTASIAGLLPGSQPAYDASKHAIVAITEDLYKHMRDASRSVAVASSVVICRSRATAKPPRPRPRLPAAPQLAAEATPAAASCASTVDQRHELRASRRLSRSSSPPSPARHLGPSRDRPPQRRERTVPPALDRFQARCLTSVGVTDPSQPLREVDVDPDPVRQFTAWFEQAKSAGISQPEAAALATASADGAPSVRMVLIKQAGDDGFVFFTNYDSRKGSELSANPRAALLFHWEPFGRQVRLEGRVERTTREESEAYAHSRPRGSQLSALASPQSRTVESREFLERRVAELDQRHAGADLPLPDHWGGFRLRPETFEFWQHRDNRLHDRLRYTPGPGANWRIERLAP